MGGNEKRASLFGEQNKWCLPSSWTFVSWQSIFYNCDIKSNANWAEVRACLLIATTMFYSSVKLIFKIHKMILKVVFSYLSFNLKLHIRMIHVNYLQIAHCGEWILKKYFTDKNVRKIYTYWKMHVFLHSWAHAHYSLSNIFGSLRYLLELRCTHQHSHFLLQPLTAIPFLSSLLPGLWTT